MLQCHKEGREWVKMVLEEIKAGKLQNLVKYSIYRFHKFRHGTVNTKLRSKHEF